MSKLTNNLHPFVTKQVSFIRHLAKNNRETADVLDSIAIIELIVFIETTWSIVVEDTDITTEKMGSISKMVTLINSKVS